MDLTEAGREELPGVRGQGRRPGVSGCDGAGAVERSYPASEVRGAARRSYPRSKERWLCGRRRAERLVNLITLGPQSCLTQ